MAAEGKSNEKPLCCLTTLTSFKNQCPATHSRSKDEVHRSPEAKEIYV
jgi:hypothetical protein